MFSFSPNDTAFWYDCLLIQNPRTHHRRITEIAFLKKECQNGKKAAKKHDACLSYRRNSILVCETSSAFCASSLENFSTVSCSHSLSKAMLHLSLTFLRLVCSEHSIAPPYTVWKRVNFVLTICYSSLSHKKQRMSSVFLKVFCIQ